MMYKFQFPAGLSSLIFINLLDVLLILYLLYHFFQFNFSVVLMRSWNLLHFISFPLTQVFNAINFPLTAIQLYHMILIHFVFIIMILKCNLYGFFDSTVNKGDFILKLSLNHKDLLNFVLIFSIMLQVQRMMLLSVLFLAVHWCLVYDLKYTQFLCIAQVHLEIASSIIKFCGLICI